MRNGAYLAGFALCLLISQACRAEPASAGTIFEKTLKNGLAVVVKVDRRAPVAVSMIWYRVGSIDEANGTTGVSHVLEHMMFKGTRQIPAGEFARIIARAGGQSNAFTSKDYTAYYQRLHKSKLPLALELEADRMANLKLDEAEFAKEVRVVMEERRLRIEDNPRSLVHEQLTAAAFLANSYRLPIIGWMSDLENLRLTDVTAWYDSWYAPNNASLVVVGDVDPAEVVALAEEYFGKIQARPLPMRKPQDEPRQRGLKRIVVKAPADTAYIAMAYHVPALRDVDTEWEPYALLVLSGVLDGYAAARLERELVRKTRVADSISSSYDGIKRGPGIFSITGTPASGKSVADVERAWRDQLKRLVDSGVDESELRRVKAQVLSDYVFQRDSMFSEATELGRLHAIGLPVHAGRTVASKLQEVTAEQVRDVARKYLIDDGLTVAVLEPLPIESTRPRPAPEANDDDT